MNKDILDKTELEINYAHLNERGSKCGYCDGKKSGGSKTWGFTSHKTRADDYEFMLCKGWRRCGTYYYKTDLEGSCCQLYTIRLNVDDFKISEKQRKAINKFNRFLNGELEHKISGSKIKVEDNKKEEKKKKVIEKTTKIEKTMEGIVTKGIKDLIEKNIIPISKELKFEDIKEKLQTQKTKNPKLGDIATNAALVVFNTNKKFDKSTISLEDIQSAIIKQIEAECIKEKFKILSAKNGFINFIAEPDIRESITQQLFPNEKKALLPKSKPKEKSDIKEKNQREKRILRKSTNQTIKKKQRM